ncbi:hypothetical protein [Parvibaculum sp. MBR-TMA-1.3b-4.2]|jgi:hypothetical protein
MTWPTPAAPGFYWAKWERADKGTPEGDEQTPSDRWEVVEVFVNGLRPEDEDYFRVFVGGQEACQRLRNFKWGPGPLPAPDEEKAAV